MFNPINELLKNLDQIPTSDWSGRNDMYQALNEIHNRLDCLKGISVNKRKWRAAQRCLHMHNQYMRCY